MIMKREEITNSQDYRATEAALEWWRNNVCKPNAYGEDRSESINLEDAYTEGVLYGWNNPQWIPVEERLPEVDEQTTLSNECVVVDSAGAKYFGYYNGTDECWYTDDYTMILFVTHWMEIVPPRKEDKE
jgi:hypothetical protein